MTWSEPLTSENLLVLKQEKMDTVIFVNVIKKTSKANQLQPQVNTAGFRDT